MKHGHCYLLAVTIAAATTIAGEPADAPKLAFTAAGQEFTFDTGALKGTLHGAERKQGKSLGLQPVIEASAGANIAGPYGMFSLYRLLSADARYGPAAWDWASEPKLLADGAVEVRWSADKDHPFDMTAVYRWSAANTLDLQVTVKPQQELKCFELFLASYFNGFPATFAYVRENPDADGKLGFMEVKKGAVVWHTFPRDEKTAAIFADGRWKRPPNPVDWKMMPQLAAPMALRRDAQTGLAAVLMAPAEDCFALSMPFGEEPHRSVYMSLFGRDIKANDTASARARLVVGKEISDEKAVELYRSYTGK
ncbi:MAG: hypothetical protein NTW87_01135 [Planctomycetota bacterium]|nr:hypothetical protein [Planctomycetota bacterium]